MMLNEFLKENKPEGFRSAPYYSPEADTLTFFLKDRDHYAERVDDLLTVFLDSETDELVGCKIKGVARLFNLIGKFHVLIDDDVPLGSFFLAGWTMTDEQHRAFYERCGEAAEGVTLNRHDLTACEC